MPHVVCPIAGHPSIPAFHLCGHLSNLSHLPSDFGVLALAECLRTEQRRVGAEPFLTYSVPGAG